MISSSEIKVFKTVEFKMPLYTPLHCIEILLAATGLGETPNMINVSINLLDLVYLKVRTFDCIYTFVQCTTYNTYLAQSSVHFQHDRLYSQFYLYYIHKDVVDTRRVARELMSLKSNILFVSAAIVYCTTFFLCLDTNALEEQVIIAKLAELSNSTDTDIFNMANMLLLIAMQE